MASFIYIIFGSCENITIGPTAIMATMVQPMVLEYGADMAVLIAFLKGCIITLLGIFHLGTFFYTFKSKRYMSLYIIIKSDEIVAVASFLFILRIFTGLHIASCNYWLYFGCGYQHSVFPI